MGDNIKADRMDSEADSVVLNGIVGFLLLETFVEMYLSYRQVKVYRSTIKIPKELELITNDEIFTKARLYGLDKEQFSMIKTIFIDLLILLVEIYWGVIAIFWQEAVNVAQRIGLDQTSEIQVSCVFILLMNAYSFVKDIPISIYKTFVLEEKHGFNKQTVGFYMKDQIKMFIVGQIVMIPIAAAVVFIVQKGGEHFFIYLWAFTGLISLLLLTIYPIFIAPLFDKYRPLEEGPLRESIERLSAKLKFPLKKLYVVEGSKRSAHSNAYFYGLWGSKRIVLFDTLLENKGLKDDSELKEEEKGKGCTNEEVLAVLAHELGHWKLGHVTKNIVIMQIHLFLTFAVFGYLLKYESFYRAFGFPVGIKPILVGLLIITSYVMAAYNAVVSFAMTILSRRFEYQADDFALKLGYADELGRSLIKLNADNLGFPVYDWMYSSWNHSHPTLLQRLNRLKDNNSKTE